MKQLPPARKTWPDLFEDGLRAVFSADTVEILMGYFASDYEGKPGMEHLSTVLMARNYRTGETPAEILALLTERDLDEALRSTEPGNVLESRIRMLPFPDKRRTSENERSDSK